MINDVYSSYKQLMGKMSFPNYLNSITSVMITYLLTLRAPFSTAVGKIFHRIFRDFEKQIVLDITCESSARRRFTCNIRYYLFFKKETYFVNVV